MDFRAAVRAVLLLPGICPAYLSPGSVPDLLLSLQIRDGPGHADDPVIGSHAHAAPFKKVAQASLFPGSQSAVFFQIRCPHVGIEMKPCPPEAMALALAGLHDPGPDQAAGFLFSCRTLNVLDPGSGHRDAQIHPVQLGKQGTGDPAEIPFDFPGCAPASVSVRIMSAGAWIAGTQHDEAGRISVTAGLADDRHLVVLDRLSQKIQLLSPEFREFVQKQHSPVGK